MKLTKNQAIKLTGELWSWLAKTGCRDKKEWPGFNKYDGVENHCFACEYAYQVSRVKNDDMCLNCPLFGLWGNNCMAAGAAYFQWVNAESITERKKYAQIIADWCAVNKAPETPAPANKREITQFPVVASWNFHNNTDELIVLFTEPEKGMMLSAKGFFTDYTYSPEIYKYNEISDWSNVNDPRWEIIKTREELV